MKDFRCKDHDRLVVELSLGLLDTELAATAEKCRVDCASCAQWWQTELENPEVLRLEVEVEKQFSEFATPSEVDLKRWLGAAAALLAIAGGTWFFRLPHPDASLEGESRPYEHATGRADDIVFTSGFEERGLTGWIEEEE